MKFAHLSAITTGLEAVATILSAVKVITFSIKSLASVSQENQPAEQRPNRRGSGSGLGLHKWILVAGAIVGAITIAYLESIIADARSKKTEEHEPRAQEKLEKVLVTE